MPGWLTSPLKAALAEGTADGQPTKLGPQLRPRTGEPSPIRAANDPPDNEEERLVEEDEDKGEGEDEDEDEDEGEGEDEDEEEVDDRIVHGKRRGVPARATRALISGPFMMSVASQTPHPMYSTHVHSLGPLQWA